MTKSLQINYDEEYDLLYASFGKPVPALNVEVESGVYIRVSPDETVVGIEVEWCARHFSLEPGQIDRDFVTGLINKFGPIALEIYKSR